MLVGVLLAGHGGFADSRLKLVITAGNLEALGKERVGRESSNPRAQVLSSGKGPYLISGRVAFPAVSHGLLFPLPL